MERRLAAILAADVVGYSRLVGEDEEGTLRMLGACREVIDGAVTEHHGRVFGSAGDSVIAEFASPVEAVRCAAYIQREIDHRYSDQPEDRRMRLRIGINLGDVIVEGDNLLGDGVNVAARLETLADAGGICLSRPVFDQVKQKLELGYEYIGEKQVKNIAEPVRVYRVLLNPEAPGTVIGEAKPETRLWKWASLTAATVLVIGAAAVVAWLRPWAPDVEPASVEAMAFPLPDKPSIAVLPFTNMSGDLEQEYFADGITDDLITDLSKVSGLFVIARNSTFVYKSKTVEIRQVAEDLGVRYVLEGSVRRAGDTFRVNAQLIDATTGGHVWAERYDGAVEGIFEVQDAFVRKIVRALAVNLTQGDAAEIGRGQTDNIEAREAFQKGWENYLRFTPKNTAIAVDNFKKAIELDPEYGRAYAALSLAYLTASDWSWDQELNLPSWGAYRAGIQYLLKAKSYATALAYVAAAKQALSGRKSRALELSGEEREDALNWAARAIALDPNDPEAHIAMAWAMITTGNPKNGLSFVETAMRLNPHWPAHYFLARAMAYFAMGDLAQAAGILGEGLERNPDAIELAPPLASIYAQLGQRADARNTLMLWKPEANERGFRNLPDVYFFPYRWPQDNRKVFDRLYDGLHIAVLPLDKGVSEFLEDLASENPLIRMNAAQTLGRFGPAAAVAVPNLIAALADEFEDVRKYAAIALGKIGPEAKDAIPALTAMQEESLVGYYAKEALKEIRGR